MATLKVLQFKISLRDIIPSIWRRIQILEDSTFWDLHIAIQDAMGWEHYHLHQFIVKNPETGLKIFIGVPDDELDEHEVLAGWELKLSDYLALDTGSSFSYLYDFSDHWEHRIECEGVFPKKDKQKYPLCLEGKRACPPENIGSVLGYKRYVDVISNPNHENYLDMLEWRGAFQAESFDPKKVQFSDSLKRLKVVISEEGKEWDRRS